MYHYHGLVEVTEARRRDALAAASLHAMRSRAGVKARLGRQLVRLGEYMLSSGPRQSSTQPVCSVN